MKEIKHFLKNLLYGASQTEINVIESKQYSLPVKCKYRQLSLGGLVILEGILAFFAWTYAISLMFKEYNPLLKEVEISVLGTMASIFFAAIAATIIFILDSLIVGSNNKRNAWLRLPIAIVISIGIAFPLELKILEGSIVKELLLESQSENRELANMKNDDIKQLKDKVLRLEQKVTREEEEIAYWSRLKHAEVGGFTISGSSGEASMGDIYGEAANNLELHLNLLQVAKNDLRALNSTLNQKLKQIIDEYNYNKTEQDFTFMSQFKALQRLKKKDETGAVSLLCWGISLIILVLELTPAFMKILLDDSEYDIVLKGILNVNKASIVAHANNGVQKIENDINRAMNPAYVNNILTNIKTA